MTRRINNHHGKFKVCSADKGLALSALVLVLLTYPALTFADAEFGQQTERDYFFHYAAVVVYVPELCDKISERARVTAGFSSEGHQVYLEKSKCFYDTALRHKNISLCARVKSVSTISMSGYKILEAGCEQQISRDVPNISPVIPNAKTVLSVFEEMGYEPDTAVNTLPVAPLVNNK